jgi:hypothetical protein
MLVKTGKGHLGYCLPEGIVFVRPFFFHFVHHGDTVWRVSAIVDLFGRFVHGFVKIAVKAILRKHFPCFYLSVTVDYRSQYQLFRFDAAGKYPPIGFDFGGGRLSFLFFICFVFKPVQKRPVQV